ncbi:MAG: phosphoribosyltransferase [Mesorhizobium sp.]|nr:phosphoribosyltransferase [Mesorhizobium sp.]
MQLAQHEYWQTIHAARTFDAGPVAGFRELYPASLPDGRQIALPVRILPGDGRAAVASLIVNQASFAVVDAIADALADIARSSAPDIVVGVPTLGLPLAEGVARRLGHARMVALGTSRKFWYEDGLSQPLSSITSPGHQKRLYLDPRMLPLLAGRRVAVVDDVISSGSSMLAVLTLLGSAGIAPVAILAGMLQGAAWRALLGDFDAGIEARIAAALTSPRLVRGDDGGWRPEA